MSSDDYNSAGGKVDSKNRDTLLNKLQIAEEKLNGSYDFYAEQELRLLQLRIDNAEALGRKQEAVAEKAAKAELALEERKNKQKDSAIEKALKKAARKKKGELTPTEKEAIIAETEAKYKVEEAARAKLRKKAARSANIGEALSAQKAANEAANNIFAKGKTFRERGKALKSAFTNEDGTTNLLKGFSALTSALADMAKQLDNTIEEVAGSQKAIDTRLQGSRGDTRFGSYWKQISTDLTRNIGMSPWIKQSDVVNNLKTMVGKGIAFNVEQRAVLETIKDGIATTFEATDGTLLKLVRIQQEDTTAARLGMESALTSFLNNMYETTEYMQSAAKDIRAQLYEASALMTAKSATEFEYQVQKWMGSLYSVGFGNTSGLSGALGKLASGDISGLTEGGYGNLLVMAANKANLSIAEMLATGLDESDTNKLMTAMVSYLGQIYNETKGSNVLAQQYASVFGLKASDLKAAANLFGSIGNIAGNSLNYGGMLTQLNTMANSIGSRMSFGEMASNAWNNTQYGIAAGIASNPVLYGLYKAAGLLDTVAGGVNLPIATPMSSLNTSFNLSDIMMTSALAGGVFSNLGGMLGGLFSSGGNLLTKFGVGGSNVVTRGTGEGLLTTSGSTTSGSGTYSANGSYDDAFSQSKTSTQDSASEQISAANEDEVTISTVNENIVLIHTILQDATSGAKSFHVTLDDTAGFAQTLASSIFHG